MTPRSHSDDITLTDEQAVRLWRVIFPGAPLPTASHPRQAPLDTREETLNSASLNDFTVLPPPLDLQ